jgi:hypothetical protein
LAFLRRVGYWRGFEIQNGFTKGEWDMDFEQLSATVYGPDKVCIFLSPLPSSSPGAKSILSTEPVFAPYSRLPWRVLQTATKSPVQSMTDPATQDMEIWLTLAAGKTIKGLIQYQANTPETMPAIFAFGAPGADAPVRTLAPRLTALCSTFDCIRTHPTSRCRRPLRMPLPPRARWSS